MQTSTVTICSRSLINPTLSNYLILAMKYLTLNAVLRPNSVKCPISVDLTQVTEKLIANITFQHPGRTHKPNVDVCTKSASIVYCITVEYLLRISYWA